MTTFSTLFNEYVVVLTMTICGALWCYSIALAGGAAPVYTLIPSTLLGAGLVGIYAVWKERRT